MRTHVLLNLLNDVRKRYKCEACILSRILSLFATSFINCTNVRLYLSYKIKHTLKVSRNRYNQLPHLTQDTNGKVTKSHFCLR